VGAQDKGGRLAMVGFRGVSGPSEINGARCNADDEAQRATSGAVLPCGTHAT
jgi:hypothetical protein